MKDNNTVEACTHCHVCQNQCEFLQKVRNRYRRYREVKRTFLSLFPVWKVHRGMPREY